MNNDTLYYIMKIKADAQMMHIYETVSKRLRCLHVHTCMCLLLRNNFCINLTDKNQ
jgi:hypothetical protein